MMPTVVPQNDLPNYVPANDLPDNVATPTAPKKKQGFVDSLKQGVSRLAAPSIGALAGISQVAENTVGKAVDYGTAKLYGGLNKAFGTNEKPGVGAGTTNKLEVSALPEDIRSNIAYKGSKFIGQQLPTIAATSGLGTASSLGILGKAGVGAAQGAASTQLQSLADTGKPASLGQTAAGAGIGAAFGGLGGITSKAKPSLYDSAFSQANNSTKKELAKYGQTAGGAVLEQDLSPSVKKGLVQIKDKLGNTRQAINNTADEAGNIVGANIKSSLKQDIIEKLGYDKLNQNASSTKTLIDKVHGLVDDMIPDGDISAKEVVNQIKNLNTTLSDSLVAKGFQDVKGNAKIIKVIESGLKKALDNHIEQGGGEAGVISKLYQQYGKEKTVQKILQNEEVRKILGRQIAGSTLGGGIGTIAGYEDFKQGNFIGGGAKVLGGILLGKKAAELSTNPNVLMKAGQAADLIGKTLQKGGKLSGIFTSLLRK